MTTPAGQRQRAEAIVAKYEAWIKAQPVYMQMPTLREMDKLTELFMEARQEALQEAAKEVQREIYLGLPNITATQCTVTVHFVHEWMQRKLQRISDQLDRLASEE